MKKSIILFIILGLSISLILTGCTPAANSELEEELEVKNERIRVLEQEKQDLEDKITQLQERQGEEIVVESNRILYKALEIVRLIKEKNMEELSNHIHPTKGLRFTAYGHLNDEDQVLNTKQIEELFDESEILTWGSYDGTGDPIDLSFADYYDRFIYDVDFANPHIIGINEIVGKGNTLNNIEEFHPNGEFIEFHFTGFEPQFEGMDWKSLRLVFEEEEGRFYLVAILHDEWTI